MDRKNSGILLVATEGISTTMVYNALANRFSDKVSIIIEKKISKLSFLTFKMKKNGLFSMIGQGLFQIVIPPILVVFSKKRLIEILNAEQDLTTPIPEKKIIKINSVNSDEFRTLLKNYAPEIIIVNGTRIISKKTLQSSPGKWVNTHIGITPEYRGVHGGYWSLYCGRPDLCGYTIHLIDKGIDTGAILKQGTIKISEKDNLSTYPVIQYLAAIPDLLNTIEEIKSNALVEKKITGNEFSKQWFHPTIWQYLWGFFFKGVK